MRVRVMQKNILIASILTLFYAFYLLGYVAFKIIFPHKIFSIENISQVSTVIQCIFGLCLFVAGIGILKKQKWGRSIVLIIALIKIGFVIFLFGGHLFATPISIYIHIVKFGSHHPFLVAHDIISTLLSILALYYLNTHNVKLEFGITRPCNKNIFLVSGFIIMGVGLYITLSYRIMMDENVKIFRILEDLFFSAYFWMSLLMLGYFIKIRNRESR